MSLLGKVHESVGTIVKNWLPIEKNGCLSCFICRESDIESVTLDNKKKLI